MKTYVYLKRNLSSIQCTKEKNMSKNTYELYITNLSYSYKIGIFFAMYQRMRLKGKSWARQTLEYLILCPPHKMFFGGVSCGEEWLGHQEAWLEVWSCLIIIVVLLPDCPCITLTEVLWYSLLIYKSFWYSYDSILQYTLILFTYSNWLLMLYIVYWKTSILWWYWRGDMLKCQSDRHWYL